MLFGTSANDKTLVGLYYIDPLGSLHVVGDGSTYYQNSVGVVIYNPNEASGQLLFSVEQYTPVRLPVTVNESGNVTVHATQVVPENIVWDNQTLVAPQGQVVETNLSLPAAFSMETVVVSYDGAVFQFSHHTLSTNIPIPPPFGSSRLGVFAFAALIIFFSFMAALIFTAWFMKKVGYYPKFSGSSWILLLGSLGFMAYILAGEFFYDLAYIQWWMVVPPAFIMGMMASLQWWPSAEDTWQLMYLKEDVNGKELTEEGHNISVVSLQDRYIFVDPHSRWDALKRIFGKGIPVVFQNEKGEETSPWYVKRKHVDRSRHEPSRIYILSNKALIQDLTREEARKRNLPFISRAFSLFVRKADEKTGKPQLKYVITLAGHYSKHIGDFLAEFKNVSKLAEEFELVAKDRDFYKSAYMIGDTKRLSDRSDILMQQLIEREVRKVGQAPVPAIVSEPGSGTDAGRLEAEGKTVRKFRNLS